MINTEISGFIKQLTAFPPYTDPEESRKSRILHIANTASLTGISVLLLLWTVLNGFSFFPLVPALASMISIYYLNRAGKLNSAIILLLITLLSLTAYFIVHKDGSHDSALLVLPAIFIFSALVLRKIYYILLVFLTVFSVNLIIWFEYYGILVTRLSFSTALTDGLDITITLLATAFVVFVIVQRLITSLQISKENENKVLHLLKEKETILKEVHHRIKNNIFSIHQLLIFQAEQKDDGSAQSLKEAAGRLNSMMVLYRKLYQNESNDLLDAGSYFSDLIDKVKCLLIEPERYRIKAEFDEITLNSKTLSALGALLNELITNSIKHAFTGRDKGEIIISLHQSGDYLQLIYSDDGIGLPDPAALEGSESFGITYINLLIQQLRGTAAIDTGSGGTKYTILFKNNY